MPKLVMMKVPQTIFDFHGNLMDSEGIASQTSTTHSIIHRNKILVKSECQISWGVFSVGPSGSEVKITLRGQDFEETTSTISAPVTSLPANPGSVSFATSTMNNLVKGLYDVEISLKSGSAGTAHTLYSVRGHSYPEA